MCVCICVCMCVCVFVYAYMHIETWWSMSFDNGETLLWAPPWGAGCWYKQQELTGRHWKTACDTGQHKKLKNLYFEHLLQLKSLNLYAQHLQGFGIAHGTFSTLGLESLESLVFTGLAASWSQSVLRRRLSADLPLTICIILHTSTQHGIVPGSKANSRTAPGRKSSRWRPWLLRC